MKVFLSVNNNDSLNVFRLQLIIFIYTFIKTNTIIRKPINIALFSEIEEDVFRAIIIKIITMTILILFY